jgi:hypothetical protein
MLPIKAGFLESHGALLWLAGALGVGWTGLAHWLPAGEYYASHIARRRRRLADGGWRLVTDADRRYRLRLISMLQQMQESLHGTTACMSRAARTYSPIFLFTTNPFPSSHIRPSVNEAWIRGLRGVGLHRRPLQAQRPRAGGSRVYPLGSSACQASGGWQGEKGAGAHKLWGPRKRSGATDSNDRLPPPTDVPIAAALS